MIDDFKFIALTKYNSNYEKVYLPVQILLNSIFSERCDVDGVFLYTIIFLPNNYKIFLGRYEVLETPEMIKELMMQKINNNTTNQ